MRAALRGSVQVDASLLAPVRGAITALPVVGVFVAGFALGNARAAISMAIGANLVAIVSLVSAPRLPIRLAVLDAVAMGFSVFVGSVTGPFPLLHVAVLVAWCFCAGMLVVFGLGEALVGTQAVIAFVVLGRFFGSPLSAVELGALVLVGALVEVLALLLLRLPPSLRFQRARLGDAFTALAELARREPKHSTVDASSVLDEAERVLSVPSLFGRVDVRDLRAALDQARRIRLELAIVAGFRARLATAGSLQERATIDACLQGAAAALTAIGGAFRHPRRATGWQADGERFRTGVGRFKESFEGDDAQRSAIARQCVAHLDALGGQLRAGESLVARARSNDDRQVWVPRPSGRGGRDGARIRDDLALLRANVGRDSAAFRHAVRLAVAVPGSALLASGLGLPRPYWVPFAVTVILKPDYSTLFRRGVGRVLGTLLGATLAALLVSWLHPGFTVTAVLVALMAWVAYSSWSASFAVGIGFVTALVLILLSTSLTDTVGTAVDRFVDVALGAAIACAAYLVWPTSSRSSVGAAEEALFAAHRDYLAAVLDLLESRPVAAGRVSACSRSARLAWADAEAAVGRSIQEPGAARTDPSQGRGLLAAALRIARANHALRVEAERGATVPAFDELDSLGAGFSRALGALADGLAGRPPGPIPELRALYQSAESRLDSLGAPASIGLHLDELVNAVDTAVDLAGLARPAPGI
jgi:uncharacterized membrane protein YccC